MSRLVVLLCPRGPLGGARSVLQDWSAAGLVGDFVWADPMQPVGRNTMALHIVRGATRGGTLRNLVADRQPEQISLCVVVPALDGSSIIPSDVEQAVAADLEAASGLIVDRIRCVVARPGHRVQAGDLVRPGWHNLVLTPADRRAPQAPSVLLDENSDPTTVGMHASLGLAGVLGLWRDAPDAAVSGPPRPGNSARLVTAYYRDVTAGDVEAQLRTAILQTTKGLPAPQGVSGRAVYVPDPARAALAMSNGWWAKHSRTLIGPREQIPQEPPKPVGWRDALTNFFRFLGAALRNAPTEWLRSRQREIAASFAGHVHRVVYGTGSAYQVVAGGVTADGVPVGWLQFGQAARDIEVSLSGALESDRTPAPQESTGDLSALWTDFTAGALTLADGQARVTGLEPDRVNVDIGVVKDPAAIAPPTSAAFTDLSGQLAVVVDMHEVSPYDVIAAHVLEQRLQQHADRPDVAVEVSSVRTKLRQWRTDLQTSYAVRVAQFLGKAQLDVQAEIGRYLGMLGEAGDADNGADEARQRALGRRFRLWTVVLVAALVLVGVLTGVGVFAVVVGAVIGAVVLVGGVLGMAWNFFVAQQHVFQMLNRRRELASVSEVAARNLRSALHDLRRLVEAYGQLQVWSGVVAAFLAAPYGRHEEHTRRPIRMAGPFPRGMKIGEVSADPAALERAGSELRRDVYGIGWLTRPWEQLIEDAQNRVGVAAPDYLDTPESLYGKPSEVWVGRDESLLAAWGAAVVRDGPSAVGGEALWAQVLERLRTSRGELADSLVTRIQTAGSARPDDLASFFESMTEAAARADTLDQSLLGDRATVAGSARVDDVDCTGESDGLARSAAVTQFSGSVADFDFRYLLADSTPRMPDDDWRPPPMPG